MAYETLTHIRTHTFVEIVINTDTVLSFSDYYKSYTIDGTEFTGLGSLMGITNQPSEIRASGKEITITISGIPNTSLQAVLADEYRGSAVSVYTATFDHNTGDLIVDSTVENPAQVFRGILTNWGLQEDHDNTVLESSNTIVFTVASEVGLLGNKVTGRRTNPTSWNRYFPNDISMERVPNLMRTNFNFGAPE